MALSKKQKIVIGVTSAIVVGTIIFIVVNRRKKQKKMKEINDILDARVVDPSSPNQGQKILKPEEVKALPDGVFPIKFGDKNKKVLAIQQALNKAYGKTIDQDGRYGETTWKALCDNVWSSWLKVGECYELTKTRPTASNPTGLIKRYITQDDYDKIISHKNFDGDNFDGDNMNAF
jgi:hypothetical protein